MIDSYSKADKLNDLFDNTSLNISSNNTYRENESFNLDIESINNTENSSHYFCTKCLKFPYIKFSKDRKYIRLKCCCINNKKILIKELYEGNILSFKNNYTNLLSSNSDINNNSNKLLCERHKEKFIGFSKLCLDNYCQKCINDKPNNDNIIFFDDIKIENNIIEELLKKINYNKRIHYFKESNINNSNKIIDKNNGYCEIISEEEEVMFNKLINIIIKDYKNYPNFSHFLNIKNLLSFFNIEDKPIIEEEEKKSEDKITKNNEPIIIEYNNNISYKTKLFSKTFVRNNKRKFKIEIEGQRIDLIDEYEFKTKERKVKIKLLMNNEVTEIDMYKMFANCIDLICVDGIAKLEIKIKNIDKIFYNCNSLLSIPDFNDWKIKKDNAYLMFYNCISLVFFPFENKLSYWIKSTPIFKLFK